MTDTRLNPMAWPKHVLKALKKGSLIQLYPSSPAKYKEVAVYLQSAAAKVFGRDPTPRLLKFLSQLRRIVLIYRAVDVMGKFRAGRAKFQFIAGAAS